MSGGVMLPPLVVALLIRTILPSGPHLFAITQAFGHPKKCLSSSERRPVVRDFIGP